MLYESKTRIIGRPSHQKRRELVVSAGRSVEFRASLFMDNDIYVKTKRYDIKNAKVEHLRGTLSSMTMKLFLKEVRGRDYFKAVLAAKRGKKVIPIVTDIYNSIALPGVDIELNHTFSKGGWISHWITFSSNEGDPLMSDKPVIEFLDRLGVGYEQEHSTLLEIRDRIVKEDGYES